MTTGEGLAEATSRLTWEHAADTQGRVGRVARAHPGADRPRSGTGVALAGAFRTAGGLRRAGRGHAGAVLDQRDPRAPGRRLRRPAPGQPMAATASRRGRAAAAGGSQVPDAGLAGRLARPAAHAAAVRRLVR